MMGLMRIAKSIKSRISDLFHAGNNLFMTEGMRLSELMFILAYPIDKHRFTIQKNRPSPSFLFTGHEIVLNPKAVEISSEVIFSFLIMEVRL